MRKLFRFKYEPCNGNCYAWCAVLPEELNRLGERRESLVQNMVNAHEKLCDNPEYSFGVDVEDDVFVGHFHSPQGTELFFGPSFEQAVNKTCSSVLETNIPKGNGECRYGSNGGEDLGSDILRACSDPEYLKSHHAGCSCHS